VTQTEVGIIDSKYAPYLAFPDRPAGVVVYWHVDDVHDTVDLVLARGAVQLEAPQDRGHGFITASVVDPFGNILGPHAEPALPRGAGVPGGLGLRDGSRRGAGPDRINPVQDADLATGQALLNNKPQR
jgi:hypothetical protein